MVFLPLCNCPYVVDNLREQSAKIDGICRAQIAHACDVRIGKGLFYKQLAVIERSFDFDGLDVPAECRHLLFLQPADPARRIKDEDFNIWNIEEAMCDRTP